jgi:ABC-type Fe3+/spermidine/putrescine transport system ATPase subunit
MDADERDRATLADRSVSDAAHLRLERIGKRFGAVAAVESLSLSVARGEAVTLLGPSGCGKTTVLRMIAGLERPDGGFIEIAGRPVFSAEDGIDEPPERREIGMVFQNYAIWPHLTVAQNVGFPLKVRRLPAAEIRDRVAEALAVVGLAGLGERPATRLSGGQQQRVALARGLIHRPGLLLLDEPLSNLDAKLREQMRIELKLLQQRLGLTLIYVTHDQAEALGLSDRILLLNRGCIEQIGTPRELYEHPRSGFARDFLGKSVRLQGEIRAVAGPMVEVALACDPARTLACPMPADRVLGIGSPVEIAIRPEAIALAGPGEGATLSARVEAVLYQGERSECELSIGSESILLYLPPDRAVAPGDRIALAIRPGSLSLWPL